MSADYGLYISWTPIGATIFKMDRNKLFENRLLEYLQKFAEAATSKALFKHKGNCYESIAMSLTKEVQEMASAVPMLTRCTSLVDKTAKLTTKAIVRRMGGIV